MSQERATREEAKEQVDRFLEASQVQNLFEGFLGIPLGGSQETPVVLEPLINLHRAIASAEDVKNCDCEAPICAARGAHKPMLEETIVTCIDGLKAMYDELYDKTVEYVYRFLNCNCSECTSLRNQMSAHLN